MGIPLRQDWISLEPGIPALVISVALGIAYRMRLLPRIQERSNSAEDDCTASMESLHFPLFL